MGVEDQKFVKQKYLFTILCLIYGLSIAGTLYVSTYLKTIGLNAAQVGLFTSLRSIIGIIAPITWGAICDKFKTIKKPYIACTIGMIILFPLIPFSNTFLHLFALTPWLTIISRFFYRPIEYIVSSWLAQLQAKDSRYDFGHIKMFSSFGTLLGSSVFTYLLSKFSLDISFYWVGFFGLLTLFIVPGIEDSSPATKKNEPLKIKSILKIFCDPKLLMVYIFAIVLNLPLTVRTNYISYLLDDLNASNNLISIALVVTNIVSLPFTFYSSRIIKSFKAINVLVLSGIICCIIQIGLTLTHSIILLLLFTGLEGIINSLRNTALILYTYDNAPDELKNTVVMINSSITAIATIVTSLLAGTTIDSLGVRYFYMYTAILITSVTVLFILFKKLYLDKKLNN